MKLLRAILATAAVALAVGALAVNASAASTVHVTMKAMHGKVSGTAHAAKVTFVITNKDGVPHNFAIAGKKRAG